MKRLRGMLSILVCMIGPSGHAAALRVSPILIDAGNENDTVINLHNQEARPMNAQVRVFRWSQHDGQDELIPTDDVVASPPILSVAPDEDYTVRLQRTVGREPVAEEAYRVVIDELPNPNRQRNGTVAVVLRYLVPAFFFPADATQPRLKWSLRRHAAHIVLTAENDGDRHIQIMNLGVRGNGRVMSLQRGLAGYVLGHSTKEWIVSGPLPISSHVAVVAASDHGTINASLAP